MVKNLGLVGLSVIAVVAVFMVIAGHDSRESSFERDMLKGLLDNEIAKSARYLFNARYDPKDGHLMHQSEIREFLTEFEIAVDSLPRGLQSALNEKRALGMLVSKLTPIELVQTKLVPARLSENQLRVLLWEMDFESGSTSGEGSGGLGGLWFDEETPGVPGGGGTSECPNNQPKCPDYGCKSCGETFCVCVGFYKCPPCRPCNKLCPGPPIAGVYWPKTYVSFDAGQTASSSPND